MDSLSDSGFSLAYNNLLINEDGTTVSKEQIKNLREKQGYCITCAGEPVKLFEIKKQKRNPLFKSKEPLTVPHESLNGLCLKCNPALDPNPRVLSGRNGGFVRQPSHQGGGALSSYLRQNSLAIKELEEEPPSKSSNLLLGRHMPRPNTDAYSEGGGPTARGRPNLAVQFSNPDFSHQTNLFKSHRQKNQQPNNNNSIVPGRGHMRTDEDSLGVVSAPPGSSSVRENNNTFVNSLTNLESDAWFEDFSGGGKFPTEPQGNNGTNNSDHASREFKTVLEGIGNSTGQRWDFGSEPRNQPPARNVHREESNGSFSYVEETSFGGELSTSHQSFTSDFNFNPFNTSDGTWGGGGGAGGGGGGVGGKPDIRLTMAPPSPAPPPKGLSVRDKERAFSPASTGGIPRQIFAPSNNNGDKVPTRMESAIGFGPPSRYPSSINPITEPRVDDGFHLTSLPSRTQNEGLLGYGPPSRHTSVETSQTSESRRFNPPPRRPSMDGEFVPPVRTPPTHSRSMGPDKLMAPNRRVTEIIEEPPSDDGSDYAPPVFTTPQTYSQGFNPTIRRNTMDTKGFGPPARMPSENMGFEPPPRIDENDVEPPPGPLAGMSEFGPLSRLQSSKDLGFQPPSRAEDVDTGPPAPPRSSDMSDKSRLSGPPLRSPVRSPVDSYRQVPLQGFDSHPHGRDSTDTPRQGSSMASSLESMPEDHHAIPTTLSIQGMGPPTMRGGLPIDNHRTGTLPLRGADGPSTVTAMPPFNSRQRSNQSFSTDSQDSGPLDGGGRGIHRFGPPSREISFESQAYKPAAQPQSYLEKSRSPYQEKNESYLDKGPVQPSLRRPPGAETMQPSPSQIQSFVQPEMPDSSRPEILNVTGNEMSEAQIREKTTEIDNLIRDVWATGNTEFMAELLANNIRNHRDVTKVQEICLKYIWDLCRFNEENKTHVMSAGLAEDIINAMRTHRSAVVLQERGCGCLWSLSVNQFNRIELVRAGAVRVVFRALEDHIRDESFLQTAFGCLRTLSPDSEVRRAIGQLLGAQRVCRAMSLHRSSQPIQRDGCAFLSNVAVDMDRQVVSVVSREEIETVVRAMGDHLRNDAVVSSACFALKNYTYEEKNVRALSRFDDIRSLLEDVARYSAKQEIRADANEVMERLRILNEDDQALEAIAYSSLQEAMDNPSMAEDAAVTTIRDAIKEYEWSEKLIAYGFESLMRLSGKGPSFMNRIIQLDVLKVIVSAMQKLQQNPRIQQRGCELLRILSQDSGRSRSLICDADGCSVIIGAIRAHRGIESVQISAMGALNILSHDPRCNQLIQRSGGLNGLRDTVMREESFGRNTGMMVQGLDRLTIS